MEFGNVLIHQRLCSHEISRRSHRSVQTDPDYPMPATSNLFSTSPCSVGVICFLQKNSHIILRLLWHTREMIHDDPSNYMDGDSLECPMYERRFTLCCLLFFHTLQYSTLVVCERKSRIFST